MPRLLLLEEDVFAAAGVGGWKARAPGVAGHAAPDDAALVGSAMADDFEDGGFARAVVADQAHCPGSRRSPQCPVNSSSFSSNPAGWSTRWICWVSVPRRVYSFCWL